MIREKAHALSIRRIRQNYDTRLDKLRLSMNEYYPSMPETLYDNILRRFSIQKASAYPEVNRAYEALAGYLGVTRDELILANGADAALATVYCTFCSEHDTVATCMPTFAMYRVHADLLNCHFKSVEANDAGLVSEEQLLSLAHEDTRLIVLANPNGVTGQAFSTDSIDILLKKASKNSTIVLIDEAYASFGNSIDMSNLIALHDNLVIVRSFSKCIGMAGLRIGYILSSQRLIHMMEKFRPMMEINSLAVEAVKEICSDRSYMDMAVAEIKASRAYFKGELKKLGYDTIVRSGNFVLVDFGPDTPMIEDIMTRNSIEYKTLAPPLSSYIRITVACREIMTSVVQVLTTGTTACDDALGGVENERFRENQGAAPTREVKSRLEGDIDENSAGLPQ